MHHASFTRFAARTISQDRHVARRACSIASALLCVSALLGCGSDGSGDTSGGSGCVEGREPGSGLLAAVNSEFCESVAGALPGEVACAYDFQTCGVPLKAPEKELSRSSEVDEFAGSGAPNVGCYAPDGYPAKVEPDPSNLATVTGQVKLFSHGCMSHDVTIEFWTVNRSGGAADGTPDELVGTAVTTPEDCEADGVEIDKDDTCGTSTGKYFYCRYSYPDVPTDTELMVKTSGPLYTPIYEYNVFVPSSGVENGMFEKDIRCVTTDDYPLIAKTAIGGPITPGHGALAGEVHDCDDIRLVDAVVDVDVDKKLLTYFTNDQDHPLPFTDGTSTSTLGLYAAIDVVPGPLSVGAVGLVGGETVTVGFFKAQVFPDAVTSVTFRGLRPFQVP